VRALGLWLSVSTLVGCVAVPPTVEVRAGKSEARGPVVYDVTCNDPGLVDVVVHVPAGGFDRLTIEEGALEFVSGLSAVDAAGVRSVPLRSGDDVVAPACAGPCTLRYRLDLGALADAWKNPQFGGRVGDALLAPATSWLLYPSRPSDRPFELEVHAPGFVTGLAERPSGRFGALLSDLPESPYSAFGVTRLRRIQVPGAPGTGADSEIELALVGLTPKVGDARLEAWAHESAEDVRAYFGSYPHARALVLALVEPGESIGFGTALGNGGASIMVHVGDEVDEAALSGDWILTHEMVHLSMPGLHVRHNWMEEGLATYLEPILRVRRERQPESALWREWYGSMAYGLPLEGDAGLDGTHSWGRLYWAGATFWLLADVAIRRESGGARSIEDCLKAVHAAGGTIAVRWGVDHFIDVCDAGAGGGVVRRLYEQQAGRAVAVDLEGLFGALGVRRARGGVTFDDQAPDARIRKAITAVGGARFDPAR
jgi:hypothetical protein